MKGDIAGNQKPKRKYSMAEMLELKDALAEAGISQVKLARYCGYKIPMVNSVLNGYRTVTPIVEAAREVLADPGLLDKTEDRSHPLKARLKKAGISQSVLSWATGMDSSRVSKMLEGLVAFPKHAEKTAELLLAIAKKQGPEAAREWADRKRRGEISDDE